MQKLRSRTPLSRPADPRQMPILRGYERPRPLVRGRFEAGTRGLCAAWRGVSREAELTCYGKQALRMTVVLCRACSARSEVR